jgi:hypothetical protein
LQRKFIGRRPTNSIHWIEESQYIGLKDTKGKATAECLSIIFSGAYNRGAPYFTEECTPYDVVYENLKYTAVLKLDWKLYFPTIVMIQRNAKIGKSLLERFCMTNNRLSKSSSSSSSSSSSASSYATASYVTPNQKSEEELYNEQNINDFTSYLNTSDNALATAKYISMREQKNTATLNEYNLDINTTDKVGSAMIMQPDLTVTEIGFNISLTVKLKSYHWYISYQEKERK